MMALDLTASAVNVWRRCLPASVLTLLPAVHGDNNSHAQAAITLGKLFRHRHFALVIAAQTEQAISNLCAAVVGMEKTRRARLLTWCAARDLETMRYAAIEGKSSFPPDLFLPFLAGWRRYENTPLATVVQQDLALFTEVIAAEIVTESAEILKIWEAISYENS
jgi:hypothetical protein